MSGTTTSSQDELGFAETMVMWGAEHGRDFPWRRTSDPFKILVAEMLLQRSRSGTVAKVYTRLFERWPGSLELAEADVNELENLLSPLGIKSRATRIKAAAKVWSESEISRSTGKELQDLPGVGYYSANATAIAMSWDADPCFDSVSIRVLRRYLGRYNKSRTDQQVASKAYSLVPKSQWRELNWAILDLASAVCMPRIPRCQDCPLEHQCKWARKNRQKPI
jgi:A/G-specific adenine glycosylase